MMYDADTFAANPKTFRRYFVGTAVLVDGTSRPVSRVTHTQIRGYQIIGVRLSHGYGYVSASRQRSRT